MTIHETIYKKLDDILNLEEFLKHHAGHNLKLKSLGFMDLSIEILEKTPDYIRISMTHYGEQNGDLMADPDMEIKIYKEQQTAEALSFQNDYMGIYQVVYPEAGKVYPKLKKELNTFLNQWLSNLKIQGFKN